MYCRSRHFGAWKYFWFFHYCEYRFFCEWKLFAIFFSVSVLQMYFLMGRMNEPIRSWQSCSAKLNTSSASFSLTPWPGINCSLITTLDSRYQISNQRELLNVLYFSFDFPRVLFISGTVFSSTLSLSLGRTYLRRFIIQTSFGLVCKLLTCIVYNCLNVLP